MYVAALSPAPDSPQSGTGACLQGDHGPHPSGWRPVSVSWLVGPGKGMGPGLLGVEAGAPILALLDLSVFPRAWGQESMRQLRERE